MGDHTAINLNNTTELDPDAQVLVYDPQDEDWSVWMRHPGRRCGLTMCVVHWDGDLVHDKRAVQWSIGVASRVRACVLTAGEYDAVEMIARHCDHAEAWCRSMKRFSKVYLAPDRWRDCEA